MTDRNPGPELDAQVAELMGWARLPGDSDHPDGYWQSPEGETTPVEQLTLPPWSTNNAASWLVVEKMREQGWDITISWDRRFGAWIVQPWMAPDGDEELGANGDTAPHAICLAALQAMGAEQ